MAAHAAILHGFRKVLGQNAFRRARIGDDAGHLQDAAVRASGKAQAADSDFQGTLAGIVERRSVCGSCGRECGNYNAPGRG